MIKINVKWPNEEDWKKWRVDCENERLKSEKSAKNGSIPKAKTLYKRKSIKTKYYFSPKGLFGGKCAYCETYIRDFQRGDIEHYRPKQGVTDENDKLIKANYGNGPEKHWGYYWLAYDKYNLLPSCTICNQASDLEGNKIGKHNRFPVTGKHAIDDSGIEAEQPLLINPLTDNPEKYLAIEIDGKAKGMIKGIDQEGVGLMTIKVFALNDRDLLLERRKDKIKQVRADLAAIMLSDDMKKRQEIINDLKEVYDGAGEYSMAARAVLEEIRPILGF